MKKGQKPVHSYNYKWFMKHMMYSTELDIILKLNIAQLKFILKIRKRM